jgi:hypothetical protein
MIDYFTVSLNAAIATYIQLDHFRHRDDQAKCCKQPGTCHPGVDLEVSSRAAQIPFAEVLTVIHGRNRIAIGVCASCAALCLFCRNARQCPDSWW